MTQKGEKPKGLTAFFVAVAGTTTQTTAGQRIVTTTTRTTATTTTASGSSNSPSFGIMTDVYNKKGNRPAPAKDKNRNGKVPVSRLPKSGAFVNNIFGIYLSKE